MATPPTFSSQYQSPPSQMNTSYTAQYEANYLQNPNAQQGSYYAPSGTAPNITPGLPPIPAPSRLEDFGNLSLTGMPTQPTGSLLPGGYTPQVYNSITPMTTSQGMTHSVFPVAQPGTYASYNYNPNAPTSSGTPGWVWALLCIVLLGIGLGGLWYYYKHRQPVVITSAVTTPVVTVPTQPSIATTTT